MVLLHGFEDVLGPVRGLEEVHGHLGHAEIMELAVVSNVKFITSSESPYLEKASLLYVAFHVVSIPFQNSYA